MLILGIVLIVLGAVLNIHLMFVIGVILAVVGLLFLLLGAASHPVGGRTWY